ncbi:MAG: HD domain-containing phosphohydrolase [Candidatus Eisenbacteria bacterium]
MTLVAVEPKREVADWLRLRCRRLGLPVEVVGDLRRARERVEGGDIAYLAGYLRGEGTAPIPHRPPGRGPMVVPFHEGSGTTEDHCDRWRLLLVALRLRLTLEGDDIERYGAWIDARFEEEMDGRHRHFLSRLDTIFRELARRDPAIRDHSFRVGLFAARIGEALEMTSPEIRLLRVGGWVHDVGKIRVRAGLLTKCGRLRPEEWADMKAHTVWGSRIVESHPADPEIRGMVRHHHERFDGRGYPEGLTGDRIPPLARVLAVADAYDAMTSARPYRPPSDHRVTIREILACSGTQFDPVAVQGLLIARLDRTALSISAA